MMQGGKLLTVFVCLVSSVALVNAGDPYFYYTWNVTYGTVAPLGIPQQVILINGQFPGPNLNSTSNNNVVINVFNNLDEPFLLTWFVTIPSRFFFIPYMVVLFRFIKRIKRFPHKNVVFKKKTNHIFHIIFSFSNKLILVLGFKSSWSTYVICFLGF